MRRISVQGLAPPNMLGLGCLFGFRDAYEGFWSKLPELPETSSMVTMLWNSYCQAMAYLNGTRVCREL